MENRVERNLATGEIQIPKKGAFASALFKIILKEAQKKENLTDEMMKALERMTKHLAIGKMHFFNEEMKVNIAYETSPETTQEILAISKIFLTAYLDMGTDEQEANKKNQDECIHAGIDNIIEETNDISEGEDIFKGFTDSTQNKIKDELKTLGLELKKKYEIQRRQDGSDTIAPLLYVRDIDKVFLLLEGIENKEGEVADTEEATKAQEMKWKATQERLSCILRGLTRQLLEDDSEEIAIEIYERINDIEEHIDRLDLQESEEYYLTRNTFYSIKEESLQEFKYFFKEIGFYMDFLRTEPQQIKAPIFIGRVFDAFLYYEDDENNKEKSLIDIMEDCKKEIEINIERIQQVKEKTAIFLQAKKELMTGIHQLIMCIEETGMLMDFQKDPYKERLGKYYNQLLTM